MALAKHETTVSIFARRLTPVDPIRRKTLKGITAATTLAIAPVGVHAALRTDDDLRTQLSELGINVQLIPTPEHPAMWVRISNVSDRPVSIDQIASELVRSDNRLYDLNSILGGKTRKIFPNTDVTHMVEPLAA